jgi:hypothetical protein
LEGGVAVSGEAEISGMFAWRCSGWWLLISSISVIFLADVGVVGQREIV